MASSGSGVPVAWVWRVFLTCWLVYTVFWTPYILREHFPAVTLVERGSLNVETYLGWTNDIFRGPYGGAYINNNPGASLTGAIPLLLLRPVLTRVEQWNRNRPPASTKRDDGDLFWRAQKEGREVYFLLVEFVTVMLVMAPATAGTIGYLCARLKQSGVPARGAAAAALLCGLATPILFRTAYLNQNLLVSDAGFTALLVSWDPHERPLPARRAGLAGLLAGYTLLCDYSGVVVIATIALYVWLRSAGQSVGHRWLILAAYAGGVVPGALALAIYQQWAFGSFYRPSQHYMLPTAHTSQGYRGFDWPSARLLWANFFDPRFGLFAYCPALLLAFAAPFTKGVRYRVPARETRILFTYFALFALFCAANRYSSLQFLTGFRYLVPAVPGLAVLALQAGQALPRLLRWLVAIGSCAQSLILAAAHENDIRLELSTLWNRKGALLWMIRLRDAGVSAAWVDALAGLALLLLALVFLGVGVNLANVHDT